MADQESVKVDPVTFEVLKNKLQAIVNEQTITLKLVSGSPIVTESGDFNSGIYLEDGTAVVLGQTVISHASTLPNMIHSVIEDCTGNPGINEGDMFFTNDPWKGALHQSDVGVVAPHFYHGKLVAWSGCVCHVLDVGGMTPGSWCSKATECYQEGVAFPPIKLVQSSVLRNDVINAILNQSRLPFLTILDLKGILACNNVAIKRVFELIEKYGLDQVLAVMHGLVQRAEMGLRRKLLELPDGIYRAVDFLDHDGHENRLYQVSVALIKKGDTITFDFSGTSAQAPGFINGTEAGMRGGLATALFITLCHDLPWNGGLFKPVKMVAEKGTLINATRPAPVGGATVMASRVLMNACTLAISRLVSTSLKYRAEARAVTGGTFMTLNLRGTSQYSEKYGTMIIDARAHGESAYSLRDGFDSQGSVGSPRSSMPNVEANEDFAPIMYLYRRHIADTAGTGRNRGGNTLGVAFTVINDLPQNAVLCGHGVEVPNSMGLNGGGPGSCVKNELLRNTNLPKMIKAGRIPAETGELEGQRINPGAKPGEMVFNPGDVFAYSFQGGGGWGDPLERDPESVLKDLQLGSISVSWARKAYKVAIDASGSKVDLEKTGQLRRSARRKRLAGAGQPKPAPVDCPADAEFLHSLGESLEVVRCNGVKSIRCKCGFIFGPANANWKDNAVRHRASPRDYGPYIRLHRDLEIREYFCPACGILHSTEVNRKSDPPLCEVTIDP